MIDLVLEGEILISGTKNMLTQISFHYFTPLFFFFLPIKLRYRYVIVLLVSKEYLFRHGKETANLYLG